ncbi:hypothetical protein BJ165DRAFT_1466215 [Panaeolus papilionaceus]|nr:hypothetical protein BJ165DRAFT_1466215 [Panaeolus papilionaceus]
MLSRTFEVSRRIAASKPELCYRVLRTVATTATSEGSTGARRAFKPRTPQSQTTAYVRLKEQPRSLAEAYHILGTLERKYGAIVDSELFPDPDLPGRFRNAIYVIFKDKESLGRIPAEGERLFIAPPSDLPTNSLEVRLSDLQASYQRGDYDPFFKVPTSPPETGGSERIVELEVKQADYDKAAMRRGHSNPIPSRQILRAFGEWGGFSKLEPAENSERVVMKQLFSDDHSVDNIHLRFALQSYKENVPGAAMVKSGAELSSSSSAPFDMNTVLSSAKQASKSSRPAAEPPIPLKTLSPSASATPTKDEPDVQAMVDSFSPPKPSKRVRPALSAEESASQQAALDRQIEMARQLLKPKVSQASKQPKQNKPKIKILKRADLVEAQETTELDDIEKLIKETQEQDKTEKKGLMGSIWGLFGRK